MAGELLSSVDLDKMKQERVTILSFLNDRLLVGCGWSRQLLICDADGKHLESLNISPDDLRDAAWTPKGNIIYTTESNHVIVMTSTGKLITKRAMTYPRYISVTNDGAIIIADAVDGVYRSANEGKTWQLIFQSAEEGGCYQAIQVTTASEEKEYWTVEECGKAFCMRMYSRQSKGEYTGFYEFDLPHTISTRYRLTLTSNDDNYVFLSNYHPGAVHMYSMAGNYEGRLLSSPYEIYKPWRSAIDRGRNVIYVGQENGRLRIFQMYL